MTVEKCLLQIKVLRLLILFGAFSSIVVLIIFSFPNGDQTTVSTFDGVFLDAWPIRASFNGRAVNDLQHGTSQQQKNSLLGASHMRRAIVQRERSVVHNKIKRITLQSPKSDDYILSTNATVELAKQNIRNMHLFYTFPVQWFDINGDKIVPSKNLLPNVAFCPLHGFYESTDDVLHQQLTKIKSLGIGVLIVTWSPQFPRKHLQQLVTKAERLNLQIIIEFDDYHNRTVHSLSNDLSYFFEEWWHHGGFYKVYTITMATYMPMFYVKNFDAIPVSEWTKLLSPNGILSVRNSKQDAIFIGHIR